MHLLMETAISDSKEYEILSFDEVEHLKKERSILRSRVDAARRKLALETKLRDAASSLNRLYSTKGRPPSGELRPDANGMFPRSKRRSFLSSNKSNENDAFQKADNEFAASSRKVEEYTHELAGLEIRLQNCDRRILEHTAGILQMTHKGLKKNIRKNQLPHSPDSMTSQNRSTSRMDALDEFDERSLYQVPEYVTEYGMANGRNAKRETGSFQEMSKRLDGLAKRLHGMIQQSGSQEYFDAPPQPTDEHISGNLSTQIQAQLGYMAQGLDAMEAAQAKTVADAQKTMFDSEDQLEDVNVRLHDMLVRTNSVNKSPVLPEDEPRGKDLYSQLDFSNTVLDRLNKRIEGLIEQKDILTRQIQQQRELNSKSDAQRDAKIHELNEQLAGTQKQHSLDEQEAQQTRNQLNLLMEQLDHAKQQSVLLEQKTVPNDVLQTEKAARQKSDQDLEKARSEFRQLESQFVQAQTELTMAKAELDSAYGSRAQRAADVSSNPAVQKEIDSLKKELKETIEDYEVMTQQSIEAEKERDKFEEKIDQLQQRSDGLELQLNEEKVKWMGVKSGAPNDPTSAMVLKNEFKKMMRETKAEQLKAFKVRFIFNFGQALLTSVSLSKMSGADSRESSAT